MSTVSVMAPADIILQQLGGRNRLKTMIGAKGFYSDDSGSALVFKFTGCRLASHVKIKLEASDTYTVEFKKVGRLHVTKDFQVIPPKVTVARKYDDAYAEDLKKLFEAFTGLFLSL